MILTPDRTAAMQAMRRKIIAMLMAYDPIGFGIWNTTLMRYQPNMPKVYEWINKHGHKHPKWLNKYTYEELTVLVSQVTKITKSK